MFPSPKHIPFFDPHYKGIKDKKWLFAPDTLKIQTDSINNVQICFSPHCIVSCLSFYDTDSFGAIDDNKNLQWEQWKYKLSHSNLFIIVNALPYWHDTEHFYIHFNPSFDQEDLFLLASISLIILRGYSLPPQHFRITGAIILMMSKFGLDPYCNLLLLFHLSLILFVSTNGELMLMFWLTHKDENENIDYLEVSLKYKDENENIVVLELSLNLLILTFQLTCKDENENIGTLSYCQNSNQCIMMRFLVTLFWNLRAMMTFGKSMYSSLTTAILVPIQVQVNSKSVTAQMTSATMTSSAMNPILLGICAYLGYCMNDNQWEWYYFNCWYTTNWILLQMNPLFLQPIWSGSI